MNRPGLLIMHVVIAITLTIAVIDIFGMLFV
jgi:hypothetical protein